MLEFCRLLQVDAAKNNSGDKREKQEESLQDPTVWYRPLIPSSPANGFLSSTIRSLNLDVESWYTDNVLTWLTRAGWEGHLQGLVRLRLNSDPIRKLDEPIKIERELFLQTLEAFPRLSELFAPQLQVITDAVRRGNQKSRIHADILDPLNDHPMAKNLAARRRQPLKIQKLTVWSLGLGEAISSSSKSLKRVLCNPHGDYILESSAVQKFFRSAIELEEFQCPRTTRFTVLRCADGFGVLVRN
ncbi:hypothetical protein BGZ83_011052 [Gryganskiella cystojenkinii]|nr:hypothetical protein BGZ83_011052 [Gryganskiella cystojenkinii]